MKRTLVVFCASSRLIIDSSPAFYQSVSNNTAVTKAVIAVNLEIRSIFVFYSFVNTTISQQLMTWKFCFFDGGRGRAVENNLIKIIIRRVKIYLILIKKIINLKRRTAFYCCSLIFFQKTDAKNQKHTLLFHYLRRRCHYFVSFKSR